MEDRSPVSALRAWSTVLILLTLSSVAWMDRSVISMVIGPMKRHFGIGDFQVSLLLGPAFAVFYILLLIPIGTIADRHSRRLLLFCGVIVWSLASALGGVAATFPQMFLVRMMTGAGEGTVQPVAGPIIRQLFGRERMTGPLSIYSLGTSAGTALGVITAGYILAWGADAGPIVLPLIGQIEPWQLVFITLGLPGLAIAFLALGIVDPGRGPAMTITPRLPLLDYLRSNPGYWLTIFGFTTINLAVTGVITWTPEYLGRRFHLAPPAAGWSVGLISLTAPLVLQAGIGFVVDRMMARGMIDAPLRVMRWTLLAALPAAIALWLAPTAPLFVAAVFVLLTLLFVSNPLGLTAIQLLAPVGLGSRLAAIYITLLGLIGLGLGSSLVGFLSQYVVGEQRLELAMATSAFGAIAIAAILLSFALAPMRATARAAAADDDDLGVIPYDDRASALRDAPGTLVRIPGNPVISSSD